MQKNTLSSQVYMEHYPHLGSQSNLSKFKEIEIISSIFSDPNTMRLDIDYMRKITVKNTNTWRLSNTFLNNEQVTEEIREINTFLETKNNENMMIKNLEDATKAVLRGRFIEIQIIPQESP